MNRGDKEHDSELRRSLKVKGSPIQSALNDLVAVQSPLWEMHTTAIFSGFVEIRR